MYGMKTPLWLLIIVVINISSFTDSADNNDDDENIYMEIDSRLSRIPCNKKHMFSYVSNDGIRYCKCEEGFFLNARSSFDLTSSRCELCKNCSEDEYNHYEIKPCGKTSNTLCCKYPNMTAQVSKFGILDCVFGGSSETSEITRKKDKPEESFFPSESKDSNCDKNRNFEPHIDADGIEGCRCKTGYYLFPRNVYDTKTNKCHRCTDCSKFEDTPYEVRPCTPTSDSVCCSDSNMVAVKTTFGNWKCEEGTEKERTAEDSVHSTAHDDGTDVNIDNDQHVHNDGTVGDVDNNQHEKTLPGCNAPGMTLWKGGQCLCVNGEQAIHENGEYTCKQENDPNGGWYRSITFADLGRIAVIVVIIIIAFRLKIWIGRVPVVGRIVGNTIGRR